MTSLDSRSEHIPLTCPHTSNHCVRYRVVRRVASCSSRERKTASANQRRRVTFSSQTDGWGVKRRCDLTEEDFSLIWYSRVDFQAMKKAYMPTLKKMAKGLPLEAGEDPRGLEHKTPQGNKRRQKNRLVSIDSVLREQDRQWERNKIDPEFIAEMYIQASAHCRLQASLMAKSDEDYVVEHIREVTTISEDNDIAMIEEEPIEGYSESDGDLKECLDKGATDQAGATAVYNVSGIKTARVLSAAA